MVRRPVAELADLLVTGKNDIVLAFSMGVTFAYVATSAFVLQSMNGLSPRVYSLDFAANAVGLTAATLLAARLAGRVPTRTVIAGGLVATAVAGALLLVGALLFAMPLWVAVIGFFVLMTAQARRSPRAADDSPPRRSSERGTEVRSTPCPPGQTRLGAARARLGPRRGDVGRLSACP